MKKVNFEKISIKNFLSFGNDPVELEFKRGLHIVTGINRDKNDRQNGLGKSALMESLYFAIFGSTIRELKKDLIPNSFTNGTCEVILHFNIQKEDTKEKYKLIRTINPSKLFLYKNEEDVTRDSIKNTEETLHNLIGATPSFFENCVIMTLNNTIPFMAKSKIDKRKFIESIFNLDIFSKMLNEVRDDYNEKKREYEIELTKMEENERNLSSLNLQKNNILNVRKNKTIVYQKRKIDNTEEKQKLLNEISKEVKNNVEDIKNSIKKIKKGKESLEKNIDDLKQKKYRYTSDITLAETNLKKIGTSENKCPVCLRSIQEHDKETIEIEKNKIKLEIDNLKKEFKSVSDDIDKNLNDKKMLENALDKSNQKLNKFLLNEQNHLNIKQRIEQLDKWLIQLDDDILELSSEKTEVDSFIEQQIFSLENLKSCVNKIRYTMNLLDTVKFVVSEEGVKSYIVKKILLLFNDRIRHYLSRLDANCICNFNEYFEEEIVNEKNKICSYNNFSGAEKKFIDFSCLFTFMDMRRFQGNITYNISIYDELFDSCLDEKGLESVTNIIKERVEKYDECVLVISHRKESVKAATGDVIFLEKKDGVTKRLSYNPFS